MDPLLAYTLAPMHLSPFDIPRGSGKSTWEPASSSTSTATPGFRSLRFRGSSSLVYLKMNRYMVPWTPWWPMCLLPCICLTLIYLGAVEKKPGNQRPPPLPLQHPVFVLRFHGPRSLYTSNSAGIWCHGPVAGLYTCSHASVSL